MGALNDWYFARFYHAIWCANAMALSIGPALGPLVPDGFTFYTENIGSTEPAAVPGRLTTRLHALLIGRNLAAAAERAIARYVAGSADERRQLLQALAEPAVAAFEFAAELVRLRPVFRRLSAAPGGAAACATAIGPALLANTSALVAFIANELKIHV